MNKSEIKDILSRLFVPRSEGLEGVCFRDEYMDKANKAYPVYQAVSDAQRESDLTFDFSYNIANRAVDILSELEDWENDDITEAVDASCPIYTAEIMAIYQGNHWAVDEAIQELGSGEDSLKNALYGWYRQIEQMTEAIRSKLAEIVEETEVKA